MFLIILKFITFCWLGWWAIRSMNKLAQGIYNSILIVIPILFLVTGIPLFLDIIIGVPSYKNFPGFAISSQDTLTTIIYCVYMLAIPPFWWHLGKVDRSQKTNTQNDPLSGMWRLIVYLVIPSPAIFLLFVPDPTAYLTYGIVIQETTESFLQYYVMLQLLSSLSVLASMAILLDTKDTRLLYIKFIFLLPWLLLSFVLFGKRTIVAIALFLFFLALWHRGYLRGAWLTVFTGMILTTLLVFSYLYQIQVRTIQADNFYENFRIDYGRDDVIKMTIYSELHPERIQILEYRGQSLLFYASIYIPRNVWPTKPLPYASYFTSAIFFVPAGLWDWGMTTSWLEEAIANFSWFGLIMGPLVIVTVCRIGDSSKNPITMSLTALNASLLLVLQLAAFMPFMLLWIAINVLGWLNKRQIKHKVKHRRYASLNHI